MTKSEKNSIIEWVKTLTNDELKKECYKAIYKTIDTQIEEMRERGYSKQDIIERKKYEKYLNQKAELLEQLCYERGIKIWEM